MLRGFLLGVVVTLALLALGGYIAVTSGMIPANADSRPGSLERWAANTSLDATLDREVPKLKAPITPTEENLLAGATIYAGNCAVCHGVARAPGTNISRGFYQRVPQFTRRGGPTHDPVEETYWKATHGVRLTGMPAFSGTLSDTQRWQVSLFLKNLKQLPPKVEAAWQKMKVSETLAPPLPDRPPGGFGGPAGPGGPPPGASR